MMLRREVELRYPKALKLRGLPKDSRMRAAMGEASTVYRLVGAGKLRIIRRWKLRRGSFPPTFADELRKLLRGGAAARMPPLIFVKR